ncbi:MAG: sulfite exporter TauE/SafE family protein [Spirochaetaceae bacterium]
MDITIKLLLLLTIYILGFLANRLEGHLKPINVTNPILFNLGKIISYFSGGIILGLLGFLIKINGFNGGILLYVFTVGIIIVAISHIPVFPKIVIIGLHSHHHHSRSFIAGMLNIFSSSASLHIIMVAALAHGYFIESGIILLVFCLGTLYIPGVNKFNPIKLFKILRGVIFIFCSLFIVNKALMYCETYLISPFEDRKTAIVPEVLNNVQYLKTNINQLENRILIGKELELNWMLDGNKKGDLLYIPRYRYRSDLGEDSQFLSIKANKAGIIYLTGKLGRGDYIIKVVDSVNNVFELPYKTIMDSGYGDDIHGEDYVAQEKIPDITVTDPGIAKIVDSIQYVTINITKKGYTPSVVVLKTGMPAVINFVVKELTEENKRIVMPSYNEYLKFSEGENPINIPDPLIDFIFYSWKGEFGGYVLIVDDLLGMTKEKAERQIRMLNINGI